MNKRLPWWFDTFLLPAANVVLAFMACALVLWLLGIDVSFAFSVMLDGALGNSEGVGYTLFYTTNFIFAGLSVALAWQAGLFNIGAEGQALLGGLGLSLVCLYWAPLPMYALLPLTVIASASFGALWAFIPGWLNAYRGSHIVITTIMFNLIASSLMVYLLVGPLKEQGQMAAVSATFSPATWLPTLGDIAQYFGFSPVTSPLNISFLWALICCIGVYFYLNYTRLGFDTRVVGFSGKRAKFAGISQKRLIVFTMMLSGALAGFIALNEVQGSSHQLQVEFVSGYGFAGIAIALMGRNHPLGILIASLLFGTLYQGGAELAFNIDSIGNDVIILIQALVVLFCGALQWMLKPSLINLLRLHPPITKRWGRNNG